MRALRERQRGSKLFHPNGMGITMNNDHVHQKVSDHKVEETKNIQERKQIDNILHQVVKERMFGNLLMEETRLSTQAYLALTKICMENVNKGQFSPTASKTISFRSTFTRSSEDIQHLHSARLAKKNKIAHSTMATIDPNNQGQIRVSRRSKEMSQRLPKLEKQSSLQRKGSHVPKKLQIDEKQFAQYFRRLVGNQTAIMYDLKITRETIGNKCKGTINPTIMERFLFFFNFPSVMSYRQYTSLVENAANCEMRFIYFFVFGLLDESGNGFVTVSDLFRFLQRFSANAYIEEELYLIAQEIQRVSRELTHKQSREIEATFEEVLVSNRSIKLDELKDLLKQGSKDRISVNCVKSTCYHQTVLSLEHDPQERVKQYQIEETELANKKQKNEESLSEMRMVQDGVRLRDFHQIFRQRRPKIFCLFLGVLGNEKPADLE